MRAIIACLLLFPFSVFAGNVGTTKTFTSGETLTATDLNGNVTTQNTAINDNNTRIGIVESTLSVQSSTPVIETITITERTATDIDGVVTAFCLAGELSVGGGTWCTGFANVNEAGYVFANTQTGEAWLGGCYAFSALNVNTLIEVTVNCMKVTTANSVTTLAVPDNTKARDLENKLQQQYSENLNSLKSQQ